MAQFTLSWDNTEVLANANAIAQRALYRSKLVGGAWLNNDFTPANDMDKAVTTADSYNDLNDNTVYQFKVQSICTLGGPIDNDNGIREMINFYCLIPSLTQTETSATATLDLTNNSITKAKFVLKRSSDNVIMGSGTVNKIANAATLTVSGLVAGTDYYWEVELYSTINNVQVVSSSVQFISTVCGPYPITTEVLAVCDSIISLTVTSIQL